MFVTVTVSRKANPKGRKRQSFTALQYDEAEGKGDTQLREENKLSRHRAKDVLY